MLVNLMSLKIVQFEIKLYSAMLSTCQDNIDYYDRLYYFQQTDNNVSIWMKRQIGRIESSPSIC